MMEIGELLHTTGISQLMKGDVNVPHTSTPREHSFPGHSTTARLIKVISVLLMNLNFKTYTDQAKTILG